MQPYSLVDTSLLIHWKLFPIIINSEKEQNEMELPTAALPKLFSVKCRLGERLAGEVSPCKMTSAPTSDAILAPLKSQEGRVVDFSAGSASARPSSQTEGKSPKCHKKTPNPPRRSSPGLVNSKRRQVTEYTGGKLTLAPRERNLDISS